MSLRTAAAVVALLVPLSACSGSSDSADGRPATPPPASAPAADGGSFAGTADIITALDAAGVPCEEPMEGTFPGVTEAQSCILGGTEDVVLLHFATPAERQAYVADREELSSAVLGQDWAVQTVLPQTAEKVAGALGGELVKGPSA